MSSSNDGAITFVVPGQRAETPLRSGVTEALPSEFGAGRVKESVRVGAHRGAGEVSISARPGADIVVFRIAGGPALVLHPETARDLIRAQSGAAVRGATRDGGVDVSEALEVPAQFQWRGHQAAVSTRGDTRGAVTDLVLSAVDVITDLFTDKAAEFVAEKVADRVDKQVDAGVYRLEPVRLESLKGKSQIAEIRPGENSGTSLVFVHGTFSSTSGTFAKLWALRPDLVGKLFERYDGAIYALDHPTLQVSPIENAVTLAKTLPPDTRLHLLTHSRGGLVAEVLARVCSDPRITDKELRSFAQAERDQLRLLIELVQKNRTRVERIVRVACPARGTLLASKRLDAYLSVLKWTLELAGIAIVPALVDFIAAVAQQRTDPEKLPGLAAQIPSSPLIRWLHSAGSTIAGDLRVVAGDIEGDSLASWLKTLLADSFYWTDNDFVVQTRSMYGGSPRSAGATFVLDQSGKVSHFAYFANDRTAEAVVDALTTDKPPAGFRTVGPLSWAGESSAGFRLANTPATQTKPDNEKPALLLIPGLLASNLKIGDERIWPSSHLTGALHRLGYDSQESGHMEPDNLIPGVYDQLIAFMSQTHEVIPVPYDWRRPIENEVVRLADAAERALAARVNTGQPVRMLAHSSGGLLARTLQLEQPELWKQLLASPGARILMLGTPSAGCWTPMQVLSGDETFGGTLSAGAAPFEESQTRTMMAAFPGFLQLQARLDDPQLKLDDRMTWERLAENDLKRVRELSSWHSQAIQLEQYRWGIPTQEALEKAVAFRQRLNAQAAQFAGLSEKIVSVVGQAKLTPAGYVEVSEGFAYEYVTDRGDGRVTLEDSLLPGVSAWTVAAEHGQLAAAKDAFRAYHELLESGTTALLPRLRFEQATRSISDAAATIRKRPSRIRVSSAPAEQEEQILSTADGSREEHSAAGRALRVTVVNGDLMFVQQPILIGHYRSMRLTGTELVMDRLIGHTMRHSLELGQYPDVPGTHQVFMNTQRLEDDPFRLPRPEAVIVVGLGEEGKLNAAALLQTIRLGVIAWAQRMLEKPGAPAVFDVAATLIGSGGKGISIAQSAQLVAQAVREADDRLSSGGSTGRSGDGLRWPRVGSLKIVELYLDRATEAWAALKVLADSASNRYIVADSVHIGNGALRRPLDSGYRGADYDFISVETRQDTDARPVIAYTLDTKRARTEVSAQKTQPPLIRNLLAASNSLNDADKIGRTLFNVLVPVEIEPFLGSSTEMVLELDSSTAGIPWELLDTDNGAGQQAQPWAIRAKVVRKLRTGDFRANPADASAEASVLVIGAPKCPQGYPPLPGARTEARAVADRFCRPGALSRNSVVTLFSEVETEEGPDATAVLTAVHDRTWRIVHIAGHGAPPESFAGTDGSSTGAKTRNPRGVVLSDNTFLGATEFGNLRVVPELVFVNCCFLAARNSDELLGTAPLPYDRPQFAATVADSLIKLGVRCVIAAGWAVDDAAAKIFATTFYDAILDRKPFIDAVAEARVAARELGGNTWAAYQCYGDPDWTFRRDVSDAQRPQEFPLRKFAAIASPPALKLALDALTAEIRVQQNQPDPKAKQNSTPVHSVRYLQERFAERWGGSGEVAEAFAAAWAEAGDAKQAIDWYEKAVTANDGTASIKAMEQLGNQQARLAWTEFSKALGRAREDKTGAEPDQKPRIEQRELDQARDRINQAITLLQKVVDLQPSMERESLVASAYKRLAMIEAEAERMKEEANAIEKMKQHYELAIKLGDKAGLADRFYPALNYIVAALACNAGKPSWSGLDRKSVETVRDSLIAKLRDDPDFWSVVGQTELKMYLGMSAGKLSADREELEQEFKDTYERVTAVNKWGSVCDNAEFLLPKYAERTGEGEKLAALGLLSLLRRLAQRPEPPSKTTVPAPARRRRSG